MPSDTVLNDGLYGLNPHGQVCPCALEMVTTPPRGAAPPPVEELVGAGLPEFFVPPLVQAARSVIATAPATVAAATLRVMAPSRPLGPGGETYAARGLASRPSGRFVSRCWRRSRIAVNWHIACGH